MTPEETRTLLELAAKAAGYEVERVIKYYAVVYNPRTGTSNNRFAPLTNDGDRYRLARACKMVIDFRNGLAYWRNNSVEDNAAFHFTPGNNEEEAFAIVRAAAEIGKGG